MKEINEFKISSMLEEFPELKMSDKTQQKFKRTCDNMQHETKKSKLQYINVWMSAAASVIMFILGYGIADQTNNSNEIISSKEYTRQLLFNNTVQNPSLGDRLASIQYLVSSQTNTNERVKELIYMIKTESNENVKLALIEIISSYSNLIEVQDLLEEQLQNESNPLVLISVINIISELKIKKGMEILKNYQNSNNVDPLVKNHITYLKL